MVSSFRISSAVLVCCMAFSTIVQAFEHQIKERIPWSLDFLGSADYSRVPRLDAAELDSFIVETMDDHNIPGVAACAVKDGQIIWTGAYGYANIEENIEVQDSTLFMLASASKTVTGVALMQLWEAGLFGLDDDINDYLSFEVIHPHHPDSVITLRMLLTHTSGINDNWAALSSLYVPGDSPISLGEFPGGLPDSSGNLLRCPGQLQ